MVILTNPTCLFSFRGGQSQIHCIYLKSDDDKELVHIATNDGSINIWDLKMNRIYKKIKVSDGACLSIARSKDYFLTQEKGQCIRFWKTDNEDWVCEKEIPLEYVGFCKIVCCNETLFYPLPDGKFQIRNLVTEEESTVGYKYNKKQGEIMSLVYIANLNKVLALYEAGFLTLWNLDGSMETELEVADTPMCLAYCEKTSEGVIGTSSSTLTKFGLVDGKLLKIKQTELMNPGVSSLSIHPSGKICVVGCWDGSSKYYKMNSLRLLAVITNRPEPIQAVIFSDISLSQWGPGVVFIAGPDQKVSLCNLYCKQLLSKPLTPEIDLLKKN